jgi:hypothetical protein
MKKFGTSTRKLINGIIIGILVAIILVFFMTEITYGPLAPQDETGSTEKSGVAYKIYLQELRGKQVLDLTNLDGVSRNIIDKVGENGFNVIHVTDTQALSLYDSWGTFTERLAFVGTAFNVKMVIHTGDIVSTYDSTDEWERANSSMGVLIDAGIPYTWCTGNHDVNLKTQKYMGANYLAFDTSTFKAQDYWLDSFDQKSTAVNFTYSGHKFIIVNVEYLGDTSVISWLTNILDSNRDSNIIVATHKYLNSTGGYEYPISTWETEFKAILNDYSNVFLVLCGHHVGGTAYHKRVNGREEIFFNRQDTNARVARIMTFDLTSSTVHVWTYQDYNRSWALSPEDTFSFNVELI